MMHAKAVIFDNQLAVIGSANMDNRSLFLNYEVALFLYAAGNGESCPPGELNFRLTAFASYPSPGGRELAENIVRLFSPLL